MNKIKPPAFHEEQRFRQKWLWWLLLSITFSVVIIFGYGMLPQLVFGRPWGDRPLSNTALGIAGTLIILPI